MILCLSLSACYVAGGNRPYWAVEPVYAVRNSPIPVPRPSLKPPAPNRYAAATVPNRADSRVVAPRARTPSPARTGTTRTGITAGQIEVRRGDTVYGLARAHGVPLSDFVAVNDLRPPYALAVGQKLVLPGRRSHVVQRGDTVYSIAQKHDLDVRQLAGINQLAPPYLLRVGQVLVVPSGRAEELTVASRPSRSLATPPPRTGSGFDWPVTGTVISRFGPKEGGLRNDGINIRAPKGAPVRASESGIVAYAGSGLRGFGNLILIRHADDWVTAYGHNDELLVERGAAVKRGQMIARVGSTGGVTEAQLHFEVRKGTKASDPLRYLPQISADAR
ncbi:hypothetical protein JCM17846_04780 [Iodidimonas nitroreducens]|uniref:LysM domain-containing protein n=1 Tax=Iodidimonas nitroreducens TaxID=1236968 RepID=A0A5A7N6Z4_9PROT|nr:hypothetical protein JCM17846_04780 [Iodidimonas nitroreducens]